MSDFYTRKNSNVSKLWFVVVFAVVMMLTVVWQTRTTIAEIEARAEQTQQFTMELLKS